MSKTPQAPAHNLEAERLLLAAYMHRGVDAQDAIESVLTGDDFYSHGHAVTFGALVALRGRGAPTHWAALRNELERLDKLAQAGGDGALESLGDVVPPLKSVEDLVAEVSALASVRAMQQAAAHAYTSGYGVAAHDANTYLDETSARVQKAAERRRAADTSAPIGVVAGQVNDRVMAAAQSGVQLTGLSTGFDTLDRLTTGLHGGQMWVVAGRPGMGKSAAAQAMALKIGAQDAPVLICSYEMLRQQWAERALSAISSVPLERIRNASFLGTDVTMLGGAERVLRAMPIEVDDGQGTIIDIRIKARRMKRKHGRLGALVVDYLQLVRPTTKGDSREQAVAEISRGLKGLAMELDIPVIALAQVNRAADKAKDKRPMLSDLRESGSIEQDADLVMFVYRDEVYNRDTLDQGVAEFIVAKQRSGATGTVRVRYFGQCTRFENLADEDHHGYRG